MDSKKLMGLVFCIEGIVIQGFAIYSIIPIASTAKYDGFYSKTDEKIAGFEVILWLMIFIIAVISIIVGKNMINDNNTGNTAGNNQSNYAHTHQNSNIVICPKCGARNDKSNYYCNNCHMDLPSNNTYQSTSGNGTTGGGMIKCPHCGELNGRSNEVCFKCQKVLRN